MSIYGIVNYSNILAVVQIKKAWAIWTTKVFQRSRRRHETKLDLKKLHFSVLYQKNISWCNCIFWTCVWCDNSSRFVYIGTISINGIHHHPETSRVHERTNFRYYKRSVVLLLFCIFTILQFKRTMDWHSHGRVLLDFDVKQLHSYAYHIS